MHYQMPRGRLCKSANACVFKQATTYPIRISNSRRPKRPFCFGLPWSSSRHSSTSSGAAIEVVKQQRPINLRSQLPLVDVISSAPQTTASNSSISQSESQVDKKSKLNKPHSPLRPYIYALLFFATGSLVGNFMCTIVVPKPLPAPGSPEDKVMIEYLHEQAEKLPIVQSLRSDALWVGVDGYQVSGDSNVQHNSDEPKVSKVDDQEMQKEILHRRLTAGPLAGSRALGGYQRMFRNMETGEIVKILWFGASISGWPGVTHGGVSATVMDETLGRCAVKYLEGHAGVTANLQVNYLKPVLTNGFYVIRAKVLEEEKGPDKNNQLQGQKLKRKQWVTGTLETTDGLVCVQAKALFVVPKKYKLK